MSFSQYQSQKKILPIPMSLHSCTALQNILNVWPLKRGSVGARYFPWNVYVSSSDCIRFCISFILKCYFVFNDSKDQQDLFLLKDIFENDNFKIFFWDSIKLKYENIFFKKDLNTPIILCLAETIFQLRNQSNYELDLFEKFIEHLIRNGNGLIVFSQQKLCASDSFVFQQDYSLGHLKANIQDNLKISIEEAFEPIAFAVKNVKSREKIFTTGSFDRLLELLATGQDFIFSTEKAFQTLRKSAD